MRLLHQNFDFDVLAGCDLERAGEKFAAPTSADAVAAGGENMGWQSAGGFFHDVARLGHNDPLGVGEGFASGSLHKFEGDLRSFMIDHGLSEFASFDRDLGLNLRVGISKP